MNGIRIFITDDHPLAVTGLVNMLLPYNDIQVLGSFHSGNELMKALETCQPDVLLLDILLPDINGKELARSVSGKYPEVKILVITSLDAPTHVRSMMHHGCKGYLLKNTGQETLVRAIRIIHAGGEYIEPVLKEQMLDNLLQYKKKMEAELAGKAHTPRLTNREKDVLDLIVKEYSNQEIAAKLFLSIRTVERHRFNLMKKFDARTPIGLLKAAIEAGLV